MTTLVVEDGTGLAGANCYVARADADAYFDGLGNTVWTAGTTSARDLAILQGAQYLQSNFRGRWKGYRVHQVQGLAWPRVMMAPFTYNGALSPNYRSMSYLVDEDGFPILSNEVPKAIKSANCELALIALGGADLTVPSAPAVKARKAGDTSEEYAGAYIERTDGLSAIDRMLETLLTSIPGSTFGNVAIVRG